ncbi:hypothetical protein CYMTET_26069, partial [Cymbomonas tetramitiformis]
VTKLTSSQEKHAQEHEQAIRRLNDPSALCYQTAVRGLMTPLDNMLVEMGKEIDDDIKACINEIKCTMYCGLFRFDHQKLLEDIYEIHTKYEYRVIPPSLVKLVTLEVNMLLVLIPATMVYEVKARFPLYWLAATGTFMMHMLISGLLAFTEMLQDPYSHSLFESLHVPSLFQETDIFAQNILSANLQAQPVSEPQHVTVTFHGDTPPHLGVAPPAGPRPSCMMMG